MCTMYYNQYDEHIRQDYKQDYVQSNIVSKTHICFYVAILYRFVIIAQFEGDQDTGVANSEYTKDTLN